MVWLRNIAIKVGLCIGILSSLYIGKMITLSVMSDDENETKDKHVMYLYSLAFLTTTVLLVPVVFVICSIFYAVYVKQRFNLTNSLAQYISMFYDFVISPFDPSLVLWGMSVLVLLNIVVFVYFIETRDTIATLYSRAENKTTTYLGNLFDLIANINTVMVLFAIWATSWFEE